MFGIPPLPSLSPFIFLMAPAIRLCSSSSSETSLTEVPEPRATRVIRPGIHLTSPSSSAAVHESRIEVNLRMRSCDSCSLPLGMRLEPKPGIMLMSWLIDPSFSTFWNWSARSRRVKTPCCSRSTSSSWLSSPASVILFTSPWTSP
eukprot:Amastigsp_a174505_1858.p3 type:complete len:146 gc:universal Amastigsp_a174505_1858:1363-926(-)